MTAGGRPRRVATSLVLAALLVGCSGGAPEGWQEVERGPLSFQHPDHLGVEADELQDAIWTFGVADDADLETAREVVRATDHLGEDFWASAAMGRLIVNYEFVYPRFRQQGGAVDITVPGASSGQRLRFSFEDGEGRPVDGVWFVVTDIAERRSAAVEVVGRNLDDTVVDQVQESLRWDVHRLDDAPPTSDADDA